MATAQSTHGRHCLLAGSNRKHLRAFLLNFGNTAGQAGSDTGVKKQDFQGNGWTNSRFQEDGGGEFRFRFKNLNVIEFSFLSYMQNINSIN